MCLKCIIMFCNECGSRVTERMDCCENCGNPLAPYDFDLNNKEKRDSFINGCSELHYKQLFKNPRRLFGKKGYLKGTVHEITEFRDGGYRITLTLPYFNYHFVKDLHYGDAEDIFEDDEIIVYGFVIEDEFEPGEWYIQGLYAEKID